LRRNHSMGNSPAKPRTQNSVSQFIWHWLPAITVAFLISALSSRYFSSERTAREIFPVLRWLFPHATTDTLYLLHLGIRKLAHVTEYGLFSVCVFLGVRAGRSGWRLNWALLTMAIAVAYAMLDEWHQSFVPLRQASPRDVALDALGALLAQFLVWAYAKWKWGAVKPAPFPSNAVED